jgi:hypothetical protein
MSDMLQLVVGVKKNSSLDEVAANLVSHSISLSVGWHNDKLKHVGHSVEQFQGA